MPLQVQLWCPSAAGAGVAPVMAYLNGNFVPNLLDFKTFAAKFFGTLCTCSANLEMGPEGPMVHMGACIASVMSSFNCSEPRRAPNVASPAAAVRSYPSPEFRVVCLAFMTPQP